MQSHRICLLTSLLAFVACCAVPRISLCENSPPESLATGFGCFYDDVFGSTVVYARCDVITCFYVYSGFEPMMPMPGWVRVRLSLIAKFDGADEVEVQLDGRPAFLLADYPWFGMTREQLESILAAKQVVFEARWWAHGRRVQDDPVKEVKRRERLEIDASRRQYLKALAEFGKGWRPPKEPWMLRGSVGYVLDTGGRMGAEGLGRARRMVGASLPLREFEFEKFCLVASGGDGLRRAPDVPRRVGFYQGDRPEHVAAAKAFLDALGPGNGAAAALDVRPALQVALEQRVQTVVLFTAGGAKVDDFDETLKLLRRFTARLFVVWCGDPKADPEGRAQLRKLCELTGGSIVDAAE